VWEAAKQGVDATMDGLEETYDKLPSLITSWWGILPSAATLLSIIIVFLGGCGAGTFLHMRSWQNRTSLGRKSIYNDHI
jgi:hypothetical protein